MWSDTPRTWRSAMLRKCAISIFPGEQESSVHRYVSASPISGCLTAALWGHPGFCMGSKAGAPPVYLRARTAPKNHGNEVH